MKTVKIMGMIAVVGIMFLSSTTITFAQHLMEDAVWFKMKVSVKGHSNTDQANPLYVPATPAPSMCVSRPPQMLGSMIGSSGH